MDSMICYCGHDCGRCMVYLATVSRDPAEADRLRRKARAFYRDVMHMDIPPEKLRCHGGRSEEVMESCGGCPFRKCCRERGLGRCADCGEYPCEALALYEKKWVNKAGQIPAE